MSENNKIIAGGEHKSSRYLAWALAAFLLLIIALLPFFLGKYHERIRTIENEATELNNSVFSLQRELLMMNDIVMRQDRDGVQGNKNDCFFLPVTAARVYTELQQLLLKAETVNKYEKKLDYSRPGIQYLQKITMRIFLADYDEYGKLFEETSILNNCNIENNLWETLDSIDSKFPT